MRKWTDEEIELLKEHYSTATLDELMELLPGRSEESIRIKAHKLGLSKTSETRSIIATKTNLERNTSAWSDEEIEILKKYYPTHGPKWIHENLLPDRSAFTIRLKANSMGLVVEREKSNWFRKEEVIKDSGVTRVIRVVYKKFE